MLLSLDRHSFVRPKPAELLTELVVTAWQGTAFRQHRQHAVKSLSLTITFILICRTACQQNLPESLQLERGSSLEPNAMRCTVRPLRLQSCLCFFFLLHACTLRVGKPAVS